MIQYVGKRYGSFMVGGRTYLKKKSPAKSKKVRG